mgnify:CR=1 FL=1
MVYFFLAVLLCFYALPAAGVPAGTVRLSGQFRGFPIPLFLRIFRKFYSTIFSALRRMAALDSSERYTVSTSPPSAST